MNDQTGFAWPSYMDPGPATPNGEAGWDEHDDEAVAAARDKQNSVMAQEQWEMAKLVWDVLFTGRGPELMDKLREMTIEQPCFLLGSTGGGETIAQMAASEQGFVREGQNSIYRWLRDQGEAARGGPPKAINQPAATIGD